MLIVLSTNCDIKSKKGFKYENMVCILTSYSKNLSHELQSWFLIILKRFFSCLGWSIYKHEGYVSVL